MNNILEKVINLESLLENSRPFRNYEEIFNMVADLRMSLTDIISLTEETIIEEPTVEITVEEPIVEVIEETVVEEVIVEETVTEEPTVEVVAPKKTTTRKK
jgi:hypothetical protein